MIIIDIDEFEADWIRDESGIAKNLEKHMAGKHDQSNHGKGGSGMSMPNAASKDSLKIPVHSDVNVNNLVAASFPYVGLSDKAQQTAAAISNVKTTKNNPPSNFVNIDGSPETIRTATYTDRDGVEHYMKIYEAPSADGTGVSGAVLTFESREALEAASSSSGTMIVYQDGFEGYLQYGADFRNPIMIGDINASKIYKAQSKGKGVATAMLEFVRATSPMPALHTNSLTEEGAEFAATTKAAESYKPTQGMVASAKRALRWKQEGKATGAGTPVGWGRATDIASGRSMSLDVVKRMYSFFSRHEVDKKGKDFSNASNPSNGKIMWEAWGGDAGFTWSKAIVERAKKLEKHLAGKHDQSTHAGGDAGVINIMTTAKAIDFIHGLDYGDLKGDAKYRFAYQELAKKLGRGTNNPTAVIFDGTESNLSYRVFTSDFAYDIRTRALGQASGKAEDKIDMFMNGDTPYMSSGQNGFGLYVSPDLEAHSMWSRTDTVASNGLGTSKGIELALRPDANILDVRTDYGKISVVEMALFGDNYLPESHPLNDVGVWNNKTQLRNLVLFAKGYDAIVGYKDESIFLNPDKVLVNSRNLDLLGIEVKKHLAGKHDQSTHGHPSIGKIPAKPNFKNTAYNELDELKPKSPEVWDTINWYVNGGSTLLNGGMRGDKFSGSYKAEFDKHKKVFQDAIDSSTLEQDATVHRWMVPEAFGMDSSQLESLIGKTYSDKAFMSTATIRDKSGNSTTDTNWANAGHYTVHMTLDAPKGTHALRINPMESEILFGPNTPIYIHDVRKIDNYIQIDASVVND